MVSKLVLNKLLQNYSSSFPNPLIRWQSPYLIDLILLSVVLVKAYTQNEFTVHFT